MVILHWCFYINHDHECYVSVILRMCVNIDTNGCGEIEHKKKQMYPFATTHGSNWLGPCQDDLNISSYDRAKGI